MPGPGERLPLATLLALFVGYAASYFHRADLPALLPLLEHEAGREALHAALPDIASFGMLVYAIGKVVGGLLADRFGGRVLFVGALLGAAVAEVCAIACTGPVAFAACRVAGMLVLGCAWPAVGKVAACVAPPLRLAAVMAFLSQSYLLGDAAVRATLAAVVAQGGDSAAVLRTSAIGLAVAVLVVAGLLLVRRPATAVVAAVAAHGPARHRSAWLPWLVCLLLTNGALALVREALSLWGPKLLVERAAMATDDAVRASAVLPLASGATALLAGWFADRSRRSLFAMTCLPAVAGAACLFALASGGGATPIGMVMLLAAASASLAMPMTLASGVLPLRGVNGDGAGGGGARLGLVDGAGSAAAVLAGAGLGRVASAYGNGALFAVLAGLAALAAAGGAVVVRLTLRPPRAVA